ncbi:MAG: bifunctional non-ous end joining protein LigD [Methylobacteriaceae bacterium]|jgi:hypothetical protein|nr:bifunctional non-ous end joining protein LigD [Methylobacteriaceae bacterium]
MAPRRPPPQKRTSDLPAGDAVASRAVVRSKRDPRQAGIFDAPLPAFIRPQLAKLVTEAPEGERWAHELKFDGYRMHARIDRGWVRLITARSGLARDDRVHLRDACPIARRRFQWLKFPPTGRHSRCCGDLLAWRSDMSALKASIEADIERYRRLIEKALLTGARMAPYNLGQRDHADMIEKMQRALHQAERALTMFIEATFFHAPA